MTFTLDAVAEPLNDPPRVVLTATEDDPDLSLQTAEFFRDGVPLRFDAAITGDLAIAYDYDADFDVELTYRIEATELGEVDDWAETWASLAAWTGSGWAAGSGVASSTTPASVIYRDTAGTIIKVMVTSPSNMTLQLTDVDDNVVVSAKVSADGTVTLSGVTASKVTGSGSYTLTLSDTSATITGTGWETSVAISGVPTTVQLVAPPAATLLASYGTDLQIGLAGKVMGIAFNAAGTFFFVTDVARKKILKFDATTGAFVSEFGTPGSGSGQLSEPAGLDLDASDNVWVVDAARNRVLKYNSSGVFQAEYGASGTGNGQFDGPGDIAFKSTGNFVVTDFGNDRIQEFNSAGTYVSKFTVASEPLRVCIGASDDIIVTLWTPDEVRPAAHWLARTSSIVTAPATSMSPITTTIESSSTPQPAPMSPNLAMATSMGPKASRCSRPATCSLSTAFGRPAISRNIVRLSVRSMTSRLASASMNHARSKPPTQQR
jgi:hypothetical protein